MHLDQSTTLINMIVTYKMKYLQSTISLANALLEKVTYCFTLS